LPEEFTEVESDKSHSLKLAFLSSENPRDKKVWSGTLYSIYRSLQSFADVDILGPFQPSTRRLLARIMNQISLKLMGKRISYRHGVLMSKGYAKYFDKKLGAKKYDFIIAPAASCEIAYLSSKIPIIYITDGTFASCLNYHKSLSNLSRKSEKEGNMIEYKAISKSKLVIVSSEWAAHSAIKDYGATESKVVVLPYGANFDRLPTSEQLNFSKPEEWKLLFAGVYWESKGGEIAFNAFNILYELGLPVSLTVLGCIPPEEFSHANLQVIPFIDKNDPEGQKRLSEIYSQHHFLILPTRFDCTPIVINEASAFAMPSLVADSGGVSGHLHEGLNGFLINYNDTGKAYADVILKLIQDPELYIELRKRTRALYEEQLNWHSWTEAIKKLLFSETPNQ
jgi:glycosyltransferase involved in cell wall biosynthesis